MSPFRRILVALGLAVLGATGIRLGGGVAVRTQRGGWRPIVLPTDDQAGTR